MIFGDEWRKQVENFREHLKYVIPLLVFYELSIPQFRNRSVISS